MTCITAICSSCLQNPLHVCTCLCLQRVSFNALATEKPSAIANSAVSRPRASLEMGSAAISGQASHSELAGHFCCRVRQGCLPRRTSSPTVPSTSSTVFCRISRPCSDSHNLDQEALCFIGRLCLQDLTCREVAAFGVVVHLHSF